MSRTDLILYLLLVAFSLLLTYGIGWQMGRWEGQGRPQWNTSFSWHDVRHDPDWVIVDSSTSGRRDER